MVDWITLIASVALSALGSAGIVEYRLSREQSVEESKEVDDWYADSAGYAAEVRRVWQRLYDGADQPGMNLSELQGEMSLLEGQISRHTSTGEQLEVDDAVIAALDGLAEECRQPTEVTLHTNVIDDFEVFREDILAAVEDVESALDER